MKKTILGMVLATSVACGGDKSPTGPTPSTDTRVIHLEGDLNFGDVAIGATADRTLRIWNQGNAPMTVSGLTGPNGYTANWTNGTIAGGNAFQDVLIRFTPTENRTYNGTLTVNANQTSGTNTRPINGRGLRELFERSGVGNTVFDMPTDVTRVRIEGVLNNGCQNFVIRVGGRLIVNEILGTCSVASGRTYGGEHLVNGGVTEVTNSNGVTWSIRELR